MVHPVGSGARWNLWLVTAVFAFASVVAGEQVCSIQRYGQLTMFNGETFDVETPCKYRLSDMTCGGFRVKVTVGSEADDGGRFSPDKVRVQVVEKGTSERLIVRTSKRRTDTVTDGKPINPWRVTNGSMRVVDLADFDQTQAVAVVKKEGVFSVEFSSTDRSVFIRCFEENFTSPGLPDTLCGDGTTADAIANASTTLFPETPDVTNDELVHYVIMNNEAVVQTSCNGLASQFQSCEKKTDAAKNCANRFGDPSKVQCLARSETHFKDNYKDCLAYSCDNDASAYTRFYIQKERYCEWLHNDCDSNDDCAGGYGVCYNGTCVCAPGLYYSVGSLSCVEACRQVSDQFGNRNSVMYRNSVFNSTEGLISVTEYSTTRWLWAMSYSFRDCGAHSACLSVWCHRELSSGYTCAFYSVFPHDLIQVYNSDSKSSFVLQRTCV